MNGMDRIYHIEHGRRSGGGATIERAWGVPRGEPSGTAPEAHAGSSAHASAEDFSD